MYHPSLYFGFILLTSSLGTPSTSSADPITFTRGSSLPRQNISVEIAIVCDLDFSSRFKFKTERVVRFWKAFFYDLNLRFDTLSRTRISFRVTSMTIIKEEKEQPFIETVRNENGTVDIHVVHDKFSKWIFHKMPSLPGFDIAMVAVGEGYAGLANGCSFLGGACDLFYESTENMVLATLAVSMRTATAVKTVAYEIAHLLGVIHDSNPEPAPKDFNLGYPIDTNVCLVTNPNEYIMEADPDSLPFLFSECTQKDISAFTRAPRSNCLKKINSKSEPIFDTASDSFREKPFLLSIWQQCRILANSPTAFVTFIEEKSGCKWSSCNEVIRKEEKADMIDSIKFNPFDGSPCEIDGRCFRGTCRKKTEVVFKTPKTEI